MADVSGGKGYNASITPIDGSTVAPFRATIAYDHPDISPPGAQPEPPAPEQPPIVILPPDPEVPTPDPIPEPPAPPENLASGWTAVLVWTPQKTWQWIKIGPQYRPPKPDRPGIEPQKGGKR